MHRVFQRFIELLSVAESSEDFSRAMGEIAADMDLSCFAYLALPHEQDGRPCLISTYPSDWTAHYLRRNYQFIDPVVAQALQSTEPFRWGVDLPSEFVSVEQRQLFDEAAQFGIRLGFTIPIHDGRTRVAALTFATDRRRASFDDCTNSCARVLQLMGMFFHAHVRQKLTSASRINGVRLSVREHQCLKLAAQGKSAWEIGKILGISRHTAASYLNNAKKKLGVRTVVQAVAHLAASKREERN